MHDLIRREVRAPLHPSVPWLQTLETWDELIERLPIAVYICDSDGVIVQYNREAADLWGRRPSPGETEVQVLPQETSAERELHRRQVDGEIDRYSAEERIRRKDGTEIWVSVVSSSVRDRDGRFRYAVRVMEDITQRREAEQRLRASETRLRNLLEALPTAVYTTDAEGRITFFNQAVVEFSGRVPQLGTDEWCVSWRLYHSDGTPMRHDECPMAVAMKEGRSIRNAEAIAERPDGTRVPFIPYPTPLFDENGKVVGAINMLVDITERKKSELGLKTLVDELNHRVKNTLATVQSIARQTARGAADVEEYGERLQGRLIALSHAHDQLTKENWRAAGLQEILHSIVGPHEQEGAGRVTAAGEPVWLQPRTALTLALVFHELITNAAKYGALSGPSGRVEIEWKVEGREGGSFLRLNWRESGGPPVVPPSRGGFGTTMVERSVPAELGGVASLRFAREGVSCELSIPLAETYEREQRSSRRSARIRRRG
jgi:PAS domain S-box-containing protein